MKSFLSVSGAGSFFESAYRRPPSALAGARFFSPGPSKNGPRLRASCPTAWERTPRSWENIPGPWASIPKVWGSIPKPWANCPKLWESILKARASRPKAREWMPKVRERIPNPRERIPEARTGCPAFWERMAEVGKCIPAGEEPSLIAQNAWLGISGDWPGSCLCCRSTGPLKVRSIEYFNINAKTGVYTILISQ